MLLEKAKFLQENLLLQRGVNAFIAESTSANSKYFW